MSQRKDIFDRIMNVSIFQPIKPFYESHKEILLYLFFGGLTFVISVSTYAFFERICGLNELLANVISWCIAVIFAYITNRNYVFEVKQSNLRVAFVQMANFFSARVLTLLLEECILFIFITCMGYNSIIIKIIAQIVVIITNYVLSKCYIFKK